MFQQENHSHHEKLATTGKQNILFSSLTPDKGQQFMFDSETERKRNNIELRKWIINFLICFSF